MYEARSETPGDESPGAGDADRLQPARPVTPLVRLGAPVVGEIEPAAPLTAPTSPHLSGVSAAMPDEVTSETDAASDTSDTSVLRRAALLRLVGLGRARSLR